MVHPKLSDGVHRDSADGCNNAILHYYTNAQHAQHCKALMTAGNRLLRRRAAPKVRAVADTARAAEVRFHKTDCQAEPKGVA